MMKKYVKPDLYFESFQLDQHIAACGFDMVDFKDPDQCVSHGDTHGVYPDYTGVAVLFSDKNTSCQTPPEQYCYITGVTTEDVFKVLVS